MINLHFSLLPRWRGAAPVQRAILAGDKETGVCLIDVAPELDEGDIYRSMQVPIDPQESAAELEMRLCDMGVQMLLNALTTGFGEAIPQSGVATYARKIEKSQLRIDWTASAESIHRLIRVGGAWTTFQGQRLKILKARCHMSTVDIKGSATTEDLLTRADISESKSETVADCGVVLRADTHGVTVATGAGELNLLTVQAPGRASVAAGAWRNGARVSVGDHFE